MSTLILLVLAVLAWFLVSLLFALAYGRWFVIDDAREHAFTAAALR